MVDLQTVGILMTGVSVTVAVIYYIFTLRINMNARQMETCRLAMSDMTSDHGLDRYATVMTLEWKDYEDFNQKYGWSNPKMFGNWCSQFFMLESMGVLVKSGVAPAETMYYLGAYGAIYLWEKYKDIIQGRRDAAYGQDYMINLEYLAGEMRKIKMKHDASFKEKLETYDLTRKV
jgi:hypothetical protein